MNAWLEQHAADDPDAVASTHMQASLPRDAPVASDRQLLKLRDVQARLGRQGFGPFGLDLQAGERVAILGPSGAGKTTLLRLLSGDVRPSRGEIAFEGTALHAWPLVGLARRRAVLPQAHGVAFGLPVELVVSLGRVMREPDPGQAAIVGDALRAACAGHLQGRRFDTLSGGEQARVQLARVFAQLWDEQEGLLLVDEPIAALDPGLQFELMDTLHRYADERDHALVAVLHDVARALESFDRLWLVSQGALVSDLPAGREALPELEQLYGIGLRCVECGDGSFGVVLRRGPFSS